MTQTTALLGRVDAAGFAAIGLLALLDWARQRGKARAWLATALGLLGLVSALGQVSAIHPLPLFISVANLVLFMGSGYALVEYRHQFLPITRRSRGTLLVVLAATTALGVPLAGSPPSAHPSRFAWVVGSALIIEWAACIADPALRFLLASRGLPVIQRRRLRALSAGYLAIAVALMLALGAAAGAAAASARPSPIAGLAVQIVATLVLPLLYVGFAPPTWLRRRWRRREADAYRRADEALLAFNADLPTVANHAVDWATRFVGAEAGLMLSADGEILASRNLDGSEAAALANLARAHDGGGARLRADATIVPVPTARGNAVLALVVGRFTPTFGREEKRLLSDYANGVAVAMDRVRLSGSLTQQTREMASLLQAVSELGAGLVTTKGGQIWESNEAFLAMTGFDIEDIRGQQLVRLAPLEERARLSERIATRELPRVRYEGRLVRRDGIAIEVEAVFHRLPDQGPDTLVALVQDVSARKRIERALLDAASLDSLTAVPNRGAWQAQLPRSLEDAARRDLPLCVAILDLDDFKDFNDDWGHQRGDRLLVDVARAWRRALRDGDFMARYGGDEFAVIMPGCSLSDARAVLQRVLDASPQVASIGLAEWDRGESADELVARADSALFRSKRDRRGAITEAAERPGADQFMSWSTRLEDVLSRRHLTSAYQPIVTLDGRRLLGYEALLRLAGSPAGSSVEELFTVAHRLGYSRALDWLGRRTALECAGGLPSGSLLFVNVSARALLDPVHCSDQMLMLLRWANRSAHDVVLEISEREVISDLGRFCAVLAEYRAHGFRFALDDVGEGHSTLEVMAAANAEFIKIARSLTEGVHQPGPRSAVLALLRFAESSGAQVIAEGISSVAIGQAMADLGIPFGQGYELGRPQYFPAAAGAVALQAV